MVICLDEWEEDGEEIEDDMTLKDELGEDMPESSGWLDKGDRSTLHLTEVVYIWNIIFDGVLKSRQEVKTADIKIKADPTKVMENELTNSVHTLDRVL